MKKTLTIICFIFLALSIFFINPKAYEEEQYIYIDPGHGGFDGGATSLNVVEKNITLQVAYYLKDYFEEIGYLVYLTRYDDSSTATSSNNKKANDIYNRVKMINSENCLLFLSIHFNASPMASLKGAQVFYNENNQESMKLAKCIQDMYKLVLKNTHRVEKKIEGIYLIDNAKNIGVLVEGGFLSNEEERGLLLDNRYLDLLAYTTFLGSMNYISEKENG